MVRQQKYGLLVALLTVLLVFSVITNVESQPSPLKNDDLILAGISLEMGRDQVTNILGHPISAMQFSLENFGGAKNSTFTTGHYYGIAVTTCDQSGQTFEIEVTSEKYKTARGVVVGDSISKVIQLYGKEYQVLPARNGQTVYVYSPVKSSITLNFTVNSANNIITSIDVNAWSD